MFFSVSSSVTECFQSVTDYLQPVTELGTPKNTAVALPGMTLQPIYTAKAGGICHISYTARTQISPFQSEAVVPLKLLTLRSYCIRLAVD